MNYIIEDNIDFYKCINDNDTSINDDEELCLITNEPLENDCVSLKCGHVFNYLPLYNDILGHKTKGNRLEHKQFQLNKNQIRCPYCKTVQNTLLPYYNKKGVKAILGVNVQCPSNSACGYTHSSVWAQKLLKKQQEKEAKILQKLQEKEAKILQKQQDKELKLLQKQKDVCVFILTRGINKGSRCKCHIVENGFCKRHLKVLKTTTK
uniref:RING-type domain-containing protein n=1 Tax=viral metagenome TaxID=1070528 RepID=A0A6C0LIV3_9ZZZZ